MNQSPDPNLQSQISYPIGRGTEGMLSDLPAVLATQIAFDTIALEEAQPSKRITLWFRSGAKRIFHIRVLRRGGRYLIQMGGGDPAIVLRGIKVCRDHFDRWFAITPDDIQRAQGFIE